MKLAASVRSGIAVVGVLAWAIACGGNDSGPPRTKLRCENDDDCQVGTHCDPLQGCVGCLFDSHCGTGKRCRDQTCVAPTPCNSDESCAGTENPNCDPITRECVECVFDSDCEENHECSPLHRCEAYYSCVNTLDCPGGLVCDRSGGKCVECTGGADCTEEETCVATHCVTRCDSDNDCTPEGLLCNSKEGHCVQCVEHVDCPDVYHCMDGQCAPDVCEQDEERCSETLEAVETCSEVGDAYLTIPCSYGQTCSDDGIPPTCTPWTCTPHTAVCNDDFSSVAQCNPDGLTITETEDCASSGRACYKGACHDVVCEAGTTFCDGASLYSCSQSGTIRTHQSACYGETYCDAESGGCSPVVCAPGTSACEGNEVVTCNADGSAVASREACSKEQACFNGECQQVVCEDGARTCAANAVYQCTNNGTALDLYQGCDGNQYCRETGTTAACSPRLCTPNAPVCVENVVTTCNSNGSGYEDSGTDCTESGAACYNGSCLPKICEIGQRHCFDGNAYTCFANGTERALYDTCSSTEYCDEATGSCANRVCTPNIAGCLNGAPTHCSPDGSGWLPGGTPCEAGTACDGGACLPIVCPAGRLYCQDGRVYRCGEYGTTSTLVQSCSSSYHCYDDGTTAVCRYDVCTAGAAVCNGNSTATCLPDGSGPGPAETDCTETNEGCSGGECRPIVCEANTRFCQSGAVRLCSESGTGSSVVDSCSSAEFCDSSVSPPACAPRICDADEPSCDGETLAVCNEDGSGYSTTGTDCSEAGQVCGLTACFDAFVELAWDDTASRYSASSAYLTGNYYKIATTRSLTEIEHYLEIVGTLKLHFLVYESGSQTGTYSLLLDHVTTSTGTGWHGSGDIDVTLQAGRYYLIGVLVEGAHAYNRDSYTGSNRLSFGERIRGFYASGSSIPATRSYSSSSYYRYQQRITTAVP